jgi:CP family cyanate transporter-like MFS transporter
MPKYLTAASGRRTVLLAVAVAAAGLNMRAPITSLPPLYPELSQRLHLSSAVLSLLAATPVICFGLGAAFAASLSRRFGEERVLLAALGAVAAGLLLRGLAPSVLLFPGTILATSAIALLNVLMASMIKRRWPERAGLGIGIFLSGLSLGAILASLLSVPVYHASGDSIPLALGLWAAPAALATLLWLPQAGHSADDLAAVAPAQHVKEQRVKEQRVKEQRVKEQRVREQRVKVHRYPLAWQVTAFMGLQSLLYYAALSWLPTMFRDRGDSAVTAGNLLALMGVGNLATSLLIPILAQRFRVRGQRAIVVPSLIGTAAGLAGSLWAPLGSAPAWVLVLGVSQGSCLALAIFFTMARAPDPASAASLSGLAQSVGYLVASAGPLELGLLHSATGGWDIPFALLLAIAVAELAFGVLAGRPLMLPAEANATRVSVSDQAFRGSGRRLGPYLTRGNRRDLAGVDQRPRGSQGTQPGPAQRPRQRDT